MALPRGVVANSITAAVISVSPSSGAGLAEIFGLGCGCLRARKSEPVENAALFRCFLRRRGERALGAWHRGIEALQTLGRIDDIGAFCNLGQHVSANIGVRWADNCEHAT